MQFYRPRASFFYFCFSAVLPETNSNHFERWQRSCRYFACSFLFLLAAIFSPGTAKGQALGRGTLTTTPSSISFGSVADGTTNSQTVQLKNTAAANLTISSATVSGTGFSVTSGVSGSTIAAGQTAELNVVFAPKVAGSVSGVVTLVSNATNSPNSVAVTGTGVSSITHSASLSWTASSSSGVAGYYVFPWHVAGTS